MLRITTLPLGSYQTNCYIVWAEGAKTCAVIDPGFDADTLCFRLEQLGMTPDAILLTHGHFDHVGAVMALWEKYGCALWMSQGDWSYPNTALTKTFYPLANCNFAEVNFCEEGESIPAGGLHFTVVETPGHTHGSVCYRCEDALFCGDTLFAGSCGRIDLPGSDRAAMARTLERLAEMQEDLRIFPGHGPASTLREEQACNPYLQ